MQVRAHKSGDVAACRGSAVPAPLLLPLQRRRLRTLCLAAAVLVSFVPARAQEGRHVQPGQPTSPSLPREITGGTGNVKPDQMKTEAPQPVSGWTTVADERGICRWSIPAGWYAVKKDPTRVKYGEGEASAELRAEPMNSWDEHRSRAKRKYKPGRVLQDDTSRLWIEYKPKHSKLAYYVAVPATTEACVALIRVGKPAKLDNVKPIADKLARSVSASMGVPAE